MIGRVVYMVVWYNGCVYRWNDCCIFSIFFFVKQKTADEMRISGWSSDVFSSDLVGGEGDGSAGKRINGDAQVGGWNGTRQQGCGVNHFIDVVHFYDAQIGRASCRERVCQYV